MKIEKGKTYRIATKSGMNKFYNVPTLNRNTPNKGEKWDYAGSKCVVTATTEDYAIVQVGEDKFTINKALLKENCGTSEQMLKVTLWWLNMAMSGCKNDPGYLGICSEVEITEVLPGTKFNLDKPEEILRNKIATGGIEIMLADEKETISYLNDAMLSAKRNHPRKCGIDGGEVVLIGKTEYSETELKKEIDKLLANTDGNRVWTIEGYKPSDGNGATFCVSSGGEEREVRSDEFLMRYEYENLINLYKELKEEEKKIETSDQEEHAVVRLITTPKLNMLNSWGRLNRAMSGKQPPGAGKGWLEENAGCKLKVVPGQDLSNSIIKVIDKDSKIVEVQRDCINTIPIPTKHIIADTIGYLDAAMNNMISGNIGFAEIENDYVVLIKPTGYNRENLSKQIKQLMTDPKAIKSNVYTLEACRRTEGKRIFTLRSAEGGIRRVGGDEFIFLHEYRNLKNLYEEMENEETPPVAPSSKPQAPEPPQEKNEFIKPPQEEGTTMKELFKVLVHENRVAGTIALKTQAGKVVVSNISTMVAAKLGIKEQLAGKLVESRLGHVVIANTAKAIQVVTGKQNKYLDLVTDCVMLAAYDDALDDLGIDKAVDLFKGLSKKDMAELEATVETGEATDEEA